MASPYNIHFDANTNTGFTHVKGQAEESAKKVSELLMLNHAKYHTYYNEFGLHNHIVHHLSTLWALGASPQQIQQAYDHNKTYQLPQHQHEASVSAELGSNPDFYAQNLGKNEFYSAYLPFFQALINQRGVEDVVREYVFKGDTASTELLGRMFSGFLHPLLHLGFALEFSQPCLAAEALASACVHDTTPLDIVLPVESYLASNPSPPRTPYLTLLSALRGDPAILSAVRRTDPPNRLTEALVPRAGHLLPAYFSQWRVEATEQDLQRGLEEMVLGSVFVSGAAQHPGKKPNIEFFMMHSANLSVFFPVFGKLGWLSLEARARLLNWKAWMDMALYAACGCPSLYGDRVSSYEPLVPGGWEDVLKRVTELPEDGHTAKFLRAVMNAERMALAKLECMDNAEGGFPLVRGDFLKIAHMAVDAMESLAGSDWKIPDEARQLYVERMGVHEDVVKDTARNVRWCGIEGAWDDFPDLEEKSRL